MDKTRSDYYPFDGTVNNPRQGSQHRGGDNVMLRYTGVLSWNFGEYVWPVRQGARVGAGPDRRCHV